MRRFSTIRKDEHGVTLVELLGTIVITSIIMTSLYSVFTMGLKTYNNITAETHVQNEADYVVSMIMNKLYATSYDDVRYNDTTKSVELYKRKQSPLFSKDDVTVSYNNNAQPIARLYIQNGTVIYEEDDGQGNIVKTNSYQQDATIEILPESTIGMTCTKQNTVYARSNGTVDPFTICSNGIIQLSLSFHSKNSSIAPLTLKSEIGF
ncbi:PilW family protein [Ectobacillus polymachus]|uniref:PilW family protein n=1 Tax=Ectobacillus polymachus TaxID=1508806 RepID=UPI003A83A847